MKKIQMVDLKGQYEVIKDTVNNSVIEVIESTAFINGPKVHEFQKNLEHYLDVKHVIPCANGTDALQIAMMGLGLKPGDEVITADFTFAATVEVIALLGLTPVLVDVNPETFNIDVQAIKKAITPKTKADYGYGCHTHMTSIMCQSNHPKVPSNLLDQQCSTTKEAETDQSIAPPATEHVHS